MFYSPTMQTVKGYPLYRMDESGNFVSSWRGKRLNHTDHEGYKTVNLRKTKEDKMKCMYVHRLLAIQFIPIPEHLKDYKGELWVNYKDGNKSNNILNNLEWSTISENIQHSYDVLKRERKHGKDHWRYGVVLSAETKKLMSESKLGINHPKFSGYYVSPDGSKFITSDEIAAATGMNKRTLMRYCKDNKNGFSFLYIDKESQLVDDEARAPAATGTRIPDPTGPEMETEPRIN
jgi:hypothetical protein